MDRMWPKIISILNYEDRIRLSGVSKKYKHLVDDSWNGERVINFNKLGAPFRIKKNGAKRMSWCDIERWEMLGQMILKKFPPNRIRKLILNNNFLILLRHIPWGIIEDICTMHFPILEEVHIVWLNDDFRYIFDHMPSLAHVHFYLNGGMNGITDLTMESFGSILENKTQVVSMAVTNWCSNFSHLIYFDPPPTVTSLELNVPSQILQPYFTEKAYCLTALSLHIRNVDINASVQIATFMPNLVNLELTADSTAGIFTDLMRLSLETLDIRVKHKEHRPLGSRFHRSVVDWLTVWCALKSNLKFLRLDIGTIDEAIKNTIRAMFNLTICILGDAKDDKLPKARNYFL